MRRDGAELMKGSKQRRQMRGRYMDETEWEDFREASAGN
jgi:hypothetical protein